MSFPRASRRLPGAFLALAAALTACVVAIAGQPPAALLDFAHPLVQEVVAVQNRVTKDFMQLPGILGTAVGQDDDGTLSLFVFINSQASNRGEIMRALPRELRGVRVRNHLTEPFRAMSPHTAAQSPPIQLGTSGGWTYDSANGYCCGGTLGSLVSINGVKYILSNYHVLESDIVSGGNSRVAAAGNPVIQPGLNDTGCSADSTLSVATLSGLKSLPDSNVDAAIAPIISGMVQTSGAILEIGPTSSTTLAPSLNKAVKKSGRTTGLTRSKITGLNATISVTYGSECAGAAAFTKTFTNQMIIANTNNFFLNGGDSGSLLTEDAKSYPRPMGLLYAGSSTVAIANPIADVLNFIKSKFPGATVKMVGK